MTTLLPKDADNNAIPAMRLKSGGAQTIAVTDTSARNASALDADTKVVGLYAPEAVYLAVGDATVVATSGDHYLPGGFYYDIAISGGAAGAQATHIAALAVGDDTTLYISEKE